MKDCSLCKYDYGNFSCNIKDKELHCLHCCIDKDYLLPKDEPYPALSCETCEHYKTSLFTEPCKDCRDYSLHSNAEKESEQESLQKEITEAVKEFAFSYNPCRVCDYRDLEDKEYCKECCYYYPSKFKFKSK